MHDINDILNQVGIPSAGIEAVVIGDSQCFYVTIDLANAKETWQNLLAISSETGYYPVFTKRNRFQENFDRPLDVEQFPGQSDEENFERATLAKFSKRIIDLHSRKAFLDLAMNTATMQHRIERLKQYSNAKLSLSLNGHSLWTLG